MTQTRHRYMTKRVIRREPLRHGQSLQTLLAAGSVGHSLPQTSSVGGVFSLAVGPATSLLSSAMAVATNPLAMFSSAGSGGSGGSASGQASSSSTGSTAATSSRRGRRKNKHSAASTSPPLGRGNKTDTGGEYVLPHPHTLQYAVEETLIVVTGHNRKSILTHFEVPSLLY